jgi:hypothetical protein
MCYCMWYLWFHSVGTKFCVGLTRCTVLLQPTCPCRLAEVDIAYFLQGGAEWFLSSVVLLMGPILSDCPVYLVLDCLYTSAECKMISSQLSRLPSCRSCCITCVTGSCETIDPLLTTRRIRDPAISVLFIKERPLRSTRELSRPLAPSELNTASATLDCIGYSRR